MVWAGATKRAEVMVRGPHVLFPDCDTPGDLYQVLEMLGPGLEDLYHYCQAGEPSHDRGPHGTQHRVSIAPLRHAQMLQSV